MSKPESDDKAAMIGPPPPPQRRWRVSLGVDSLRGRYLYGAASFLLVLIGAAWMAHVDVRNVTGHGLANTGERQEVRKILLELTDELWHTQTTLQDFMLVPEDAVRNRVLHHHAESRRHAQRLMQHAWVISTPEAQANARELLAGLHSLGQGIERAIAIRTDPYRLFPAMPIIRTTMLDAYTEFYTSATLAMNEAETNSGNPVQNELYRLFSGARHAFALMVGTLRNWVANRFGVFDEPEAGMRGQERNISLYAEMAQTFLAKLGEHERRGQLELQQDEALQRMRSSLRKWLEAYQEVHAIYTSERWRMDTPLMRETIQPQFARIWEDLRALGKAVEAHSVQDLSGLAAAADQLSRVIWLLALFGVMITLAGFAFFEHAVRRPMARVAEALKAEAEGRLDVEVPGAGTVETMNLVAAFDHMRRQVKSRQQRLETILNNAAEGIITFDRHGIIQGFNRAAENLFGWREHEVVSTYITRLFSPAPHERRAGYLQHFLRTELQRLIGHEGEITGRHKDGATFPMALKITQMELEGETLYIGMVADISERKALMEHLKNMAEHDGLTGLYNRTYFQTELERVVERVRRTHKTCALLYIDLDNFKYVNDTLGHPAGDRLLIEVAGILHRRARKSDLIARFGGDEFTVLLYDIAPEQAVRAAESFRRQLADYAFRQGSEQITVGCSIGVALIGPGTQSAEEVLSQADIACHLAKRGGRNRVHFYQPADSESVANMTLDMGWSRRIREAIDKGRFVLACQPIVSTRKRCIEYYEVLIRMLDDHDEYIMPSGFLPTAERFGLSADIDKWVIVNAIDTLAEQRLACPDLRYSINLSAQTLNTPEVCDLVRQRLQATGLEPSALMFEVTETVAIADMAAAESFLSRLRAMGCRTALDDFGSGMASFAYLKDLPVDCVKIDGRFVKNLAASRVDQAMVKAMNEIAHALGKQTIAEFVENEESLNWLVKIGVDYAQGYHLGRPDVTLPCKAIAERGGDANLCAL